MKRIVILICITLSVFNGEAQIYPSSHPPFPQEQVNSLGRQFYSTTTDQTGTDYKKGNALTPVKQSVLPVLSKVKNFRNSKMGMSYTTQLVQSHDTIYVGAIPHDTLFITGKWTHTGPIVVLNDGVLIFYKATVIDSGDVYVLGNGKLLADSSSLTFPQEYFYQRSLIATGNALVIIQHSSFNYSGVSHNLVLGDSATVIMNQVHQNDWTTCGLFGRPTLILNGVNQAGEYILNDSCTASFTNTDTLLLWHHIPGRAIINYTFPADDTVYNYKFNNTINGISGINYSVSADTCHNVMWALMPENGSDITISDSRLRAIGAWFKNQDTTVVSHIYNNSTYTNYAAPLTDRKLRLINSYVQTWSIYVFDKSAVLIDSCQLGEVGTEQRSSIISSSFVLDGTGGYFWATDTSVLFATGVTVYSYVRSERNGILVFAYGSTPFSAPSAIGKSLIICSQSNTAADPIAYDAGVARLTKIDQPDTIAAHTTVPISGSAWISHGPDGGWLDFEHYSLYYQKKGATGWTSIVKDSTSPVYHSTLGLWDTNGLLPGDYLLRLLVKDNFKDSVEAIKPVIIQTNTTGVTQLTSPDPAFKIYPNPAQSIVALELGTMVNEPMEIEVLNALGEEVYHSEIYNQRFTIDVSAWPDGFYLIRMEEKIMRFFKN